VPPSRPFLRFALGALLLAGLLLLVGCTTGDPQSTFAPEGDVADRQRDLFNMVLWPAIFIMVLVLGGLVYIAVRFRRRSADEPPPVQTHGNTRLEIAWTIAPAILLLIIAVPTVDAIVDLGRDPSPDALKIRVTGIQWRWQFEYLDPEYEKADGEPLRVFDQFHIPVDREIGVELESVDVLHSFWLPKLAGKLDVVPGRTNRMWFNATKPGTYSGQCAEFCGLSHADMRMSVVAESEEDFEAWIQDQLQGGAAADPGSGPALVASGE